MASEEQETLWVLRAQCKDREAVEALLRSVQPALHRFLRSIVGGVSRIRPALSHLAGC